MEPCLCVILKETEQEDNSLDRMDCDNHLPDISKVCIAVDQYFMIIVLHWTYYMINKNICCAINIRPLLKQPTLSMPRKSIEATVQDFHLYTPESDHLPTLPCTQLNDLPQIPPAVVDLIYFYGMDLCCGEPLGNKELTEKNSPFSLTMKL